jgi:hypothetical protein
MAALAHPITEMQPRRAYDIHASRNVFFRINKAFFDHLKLRFDLARFVHGSLAR